MNMKKFGAQQKLSAQAPVFIPMACTLHQMQSSAYVEPMHAFPWQQSTQGDRYDPEGRRLSMTLDTAAQWSKQVSHISVASTRAPSIGKASSDCEYCSACSNSTYSDTEDSLEDEVDNSPKEASQDTDSLSLKASANSWLANRRAQRACENQGKDGESNEDSVRKMKSILNKLTIEKFPVLTKQLFDCVRNSLQLKALVHEILEKATTQHHFICMYADLCSVLQAHFACSSTSSDPDMNFKKILLTACQASFEKRLTAPARLKMLHGEDLEIAKQFYKMQMLGNIKFVGALLVRKMLGAKVMLAIINELLSDSSPEALESLAALLTVVGPTFDQPECPQRPSLAVAFDRIEALSRDPCVTHRICCLLKDVLELRASCWQDHKPKKLDGPSTLDQVAQKFHAECAAPPSPIRRSSTSDLDRVSPKLCGMKPVISTLTNSTCVQAPSPKSNLCREGAPQHTVARPSCTAEPVGAANHCTDPESKQGARKPSHEHESTLRPRTYKVSDNIEEQLKSFIEANGIDEEGAEDLKARSREVQEMVLSRGDVTSARNPSALLRVRINQVLRELNRTAKSKLSSMERARASRKEHKEAAKATEKLETTQVVEACNGQFNEAACRKELAEVYAELMSSHDVQEAVRRTASLAVPSSLQAEQLSELLSYIVEKSSAEMRTIGFRFIVAIFQTECWRHAALEKGLRSFARLRADLQLDVPALPKILFEEMSPAFQPLVSSGLLSIRQLQECSGAQK